MPLEDFIVEPDSAPVSVALEPAYNAFHSLLLLTKAAKLSGLDDWVARTLEKLTPRERRRHNLVIVGFYYAIMPQQSWPSFPAYVDHLATRNPNNLRDKLLTAYARLPLLAECHGEIEPAESVPVDLEAILKDEDSYLEFLGERFEMDDQAAQQEAQAYSFVVDPPAMQDLIVSHLRKMWDEHLADEWARVEPMLQDAVRAFQQVDLSRMDKYEAARWITGQDLNEKKWPKVFEKSEQIILVPSAHVGPYLGKFGASDTFRIVFGARLPEGIQYDAPDLSRAEIVMRLSALADDNRLRILRLVSEADELSSQQIMSNLGFSQSATSRHLKQLSATGYLTERRCNGAKCFRLDPERIEGTLGAVSKFLLSK